MFKFHKTDYVALGFDAEAHTGRIIKAAKIKPIPAKAKPRTRLISWTNHTGAPGSQN